MLFQIALIQNNRLISLTSNIHIPDNIRNLSIILGPGAGPGKN